MSGFIKKSLSHKYKGIGQQPVAMPQSMAQRPDTAPCTPSTADRRCRRICGTGYSSGYTETLRSSQRPSSASRRPCGRASHSSAWQRSAPFGHCHSAASAVHALDQPVPPLVMTSLTYDQAVFTADAADSSHAASAVPITPEPGNDAQDAVVIAILLIPAQALVNLLQQPLFQPALFRTPERTAVSLLADTQRAIHRCCKPASQVRVE